MAVTYDGSFMSIYQDGTRVGRLARQGAIAVALEDLTWIGDQPPAGDAGFDGYIDDLRILSRALTEEQIDELMTVRLAPPPG